MHFTGTESLPLILLLLKHKKMFSWHGGFLLMQCIITEKQSIKLTQYDETKKKRVYSPTFAHVR